MGWTGSWKLCPFIDECPDTPPEEKYKAIGGNDVFALGSADGIRWRKLQEEMIMNQQNYGHGFDSLNTAFWDRNGHVYRCFSRSSRYAPSGLRIREISMNTSHNFTDWGQREMLHYMDSKDDEGYYTNSIILCPEAEHIYLAFPMRFFKYKKRVADHSQTGLSDTAFLSSRDGLNWDRTFGEAWCRPGLNLSNWKARSGVLAKGCVQLKPDEFSFYIQEAYCQPNNRLRRLSIRKHGFGSVHAGYEMGEWITRPFLFRGSRLIANYSTSASGFIQAELQDEFGQPIPGLTMNDMEPLYGDEVEGTMAWKTDVDPGVWNGKPARLRIQMKDADLFSLKWL